MQTKTMNPTTIPLPVLHEQSPPGSRGNGAAAALDGQPLQRKRSFPGDPFSPHKILNHVEKLQQIAQGQTVFPITVEIDPSNKCNHRCDWCVSIESHTGEKLDLDQFHELIAELKRARTRSIVIKGGGEPTLHPEFNEMVRAGSSEGLSVGLISNGTLPWAGSVEAVLECCEWVRISLDAASSTTHRAIHGSGDFVKITDNIKALSRGAEATLVGINFVAEPRNYQEILAFTQMARVFGAGYVSIRCVFDKQNPPSEGVRRSMRQQAAAAKALEGDSFRVLLGNFTDDYLSGQEEREFPFQKCLGPNLIGIVGADAEVYACCFLRGNKQFSFGNLADEKFEEIWNGKRRKQVMESVYRGECGHVCMGGMTSSRYNTYNEILNYLMEEEKQHANFA